MPFGRQATATAHEAPTSKVFTWQSVGAVEEQKVAFCCAGVMKGGTTALFEYLARHPQVCSPFHKECNYFNDCARVIDWSAPDYSKFHDLFPKASGSQLRGDFTPSYLFRPYAMDRMAEYNPHMKIILMFRDPVERAYSHWKQISLCDCACGDGNCAWVKEELTFSEAIRTDRGPPAPPPNPFLALCNRDGYVKMGFYGEQLKNLLAVFPSKQVLCLRSEDLDQRPTEVLSKVCRFLGISLYNRDLPRCRAHQGVKSKSMSEEDELYLREIYQSDLTLFGQLSGLDVSGWIDPKAASAKLEDQRKVSFVLSGDWPGASNSVQMLKDMSGISFATSESSMAVVGHNDWTLFGQAAAPPITIAELMERNSCHFFDMPPDSSGALNNYAQHVSRYHAMFDEGNPGMRGEYTPSYFSCRPALVRMKEYNPAMKMIVIFQDPVKRTFLHWAHDQTRYLHSWSFGSCIRNTSDELAGQQDYLERGRYGAQLDYALSLFPRSQMLLLRAQDLEDSPVHAFESVFKFLDIPVDAANLELFRGGARTETGDADEAGFVMDSNDGEFLRQLYADDLRHFQILSGIDVSSWLPAL